MIPAIYTIPNLYKNDTYNGVQFEIFNYPEITNPVDLTFAQIQCEFRFESPTGTVVKTLTVGDGIIKINANLGQFRILPFVVDWEPGEYFYDIQITF